MLEEDKVGATETLGEDEKPLAPSQEKPKRSEAETTAFNLRKQGDKAKELGLNPAEILGISVSEASDEVPDWYKREKSNEIKQTAIQMAEAIQDEDTRNAVKEALSNRVTPSGNAEEDFRFALGAVSAGKNKQVLEEVTRYVAPKRVSGGGSMPAHVEEEFVPTAEERIFMGPPYNTPLEKIKAARKKQ